MATKQKEINYKEAREKGAEIVNAKKERDKKIKSYEQSIRDFKQKELAKNADLSKKKNKKEK